MAVGPRIGELLVAAGLVTEEQLAEVLAEQGRDGKRLGHLLVERGYVTEVDLTQILSQQLSVAWVSLNHVYFTRELLRLLTVDLAERLTVIPVHTRAGESGTRILYIAMDDPTNIEAMEQVARYTGMNVRPLIAPPSEIRKAIASQYGTDG
jgi:type IV pilus assembly protein PilB